MNNSQLFPNREVLFSPSAGEPIDIDAVAEHEAMRRATKVEHTDLITLVDMLAFLDAHMARRDLDHANTDEGHLADGRVVGFDYYDRAGGHGGKVGLSGDDTLAVDVGVVLGVGNASVQGLGEVGSVDDIGLDNLARDGSVPAVVAQSAEEGLVDGSADELVRDGITAEHILDGVRLLLDPEGVAGLDVALDGVRLGLARVDDHAVVVRTGDWADAILEVAREEVVPGFEAAVRGLRVGHEHLVDRVVGFATQVADIFQVLLGRGTEPVQGVFAQDIGGLRRLQVGTPDVQDLLEHPVDLGVNEGSMATGSSHPPDKNGVHGHSNKRHPVLPLAVIRGALDHMVQHCEHLVVVANSRSTADGLVVAAVAGDFIEHALDEHVDARVGFNEVLEFLDDGVEFLRVCIDATGNV